MKTQGDVERLEKTIRQLGAIYREMSLLSKKSPIDAVNPFKLGMINKTIEMGNEVLSDVDQAIDGFERFEEDEAPSTSDVVFVIAQYIEEIRGFREAHVVSHNYKSVYRLDGKPSDVSAN